MDAYIIDPSKHRDIRPDVMESATRPRIMPAEYYRGTTVSERAMLGQRTGFYGLPTKELIDWLKDQIGERSAIEIGAGHGGIAAALGIPATDNHMQADPAIMALYGSVQTVRYGANVEKLDAAEAVEKYKPQVVVACWVTHLYREDRHEAGGNMFGVNEEEIIDNCESYIFIGNINTHKGKSIWSRPHRIFYPDWLYSRAFNGSKDFIAIWGK